MINTPSKAYGIKILNRIKSIRDKNVSSFMDPALAELNKIKIGLNAETRKWRSETLVEGTDDTNPLIQRKGIGRTENIKWRLALEGIDSAKTIRSSSLKYARLPVTMLADRTSKATQPNYAMLIHSCLMLSMATYNLKLNGENIVMNLAFSLSPTINMINSVLQESDLKPLPTPEEVVKEAERNEEMNKHRAFILANTAMGIAGLSPDNIQTKIIASDKACCLITYEKRRSTVTVSFRGTADPIDVVTDISFFTSRYSLTYSLTYSLSHSSLSHSLTHSLTHSVTLGHGRSIKNTEKESLIGPMAMSMLGSTKRTVEAVMVWRKIIMVTVLFSSMLVCSTSIKDMVKEKEF